MCTRYDFSHTTIFVPVSSLFFTHLHQLVLRSACVSRSAAIAGVLASAANSAFVDAGLHAHATTLAETHHKDSIKQAEEHHNEDIKLQLKLFSKEIRTEMRHFREQLKQAEM